MGHVSHPLRVRSSRQRGWRKPEGAIVVARPTKWGNRFAVDQERRRAEAVALFREYLTNLHLHAEPELRASFAWMRRHLADLSGHQLCCWCPLDELCHADVLAELANAQIFLAAAALQEDDDA